MKIRSSQSRSAPVTLRTVAERVGLAPCSVSAVLNDTPAALAIPQHTKLRVLQAVRELNYRPNLAARSLRTRRTYTVAALVSEIGNPLVAAVVAGAEETFRWKGYALLITRAQLDAHSRALLEIQLRQRGVEGVVVVDALPSPDLALPFESVELPDQFTWDSVSNALRNELRTAGEESAQLLLQQLESKASPAPGETPIGQFPRQPQAGTAGDNALSSQFQFAD